MVKGTQSQNNRPRGSRLREEAEQKRKRLREREALVPIPPPVDAPVAPPKYASVPGWTPRKSAPWEWMKANSSVAAFRLNDGSGWVRVQHKDGRQLIVPWPAFEGWDEAMPPAVGRLNLELGGYETGNVGEAISYLRVRATWEKITGVWSEVAAVLGSTT